jgi:minimal PKS acyl carrier protein
MTELWSNGSFTLDDLRTIMRTCAGVDESVDLESDIGNITFEDLGYDSLAVLEMAAKAQNEMGIVISDDEAQKLMTPGSLVEYVCIQLPT